MGISILVKISDEMTVLPSSRLLGCQCFQPVPEAPLVANVLRLEKVKSSCDVAIPKQTVIQIRASKVNK
jgi:hypothetical protein